MTTLKESCSEQNYCLMTPFNLATWQLFFYKIGNLNAACAQVFKYTDVVGKIFKKSPESTVKSFIKAMGDGDADIITFLFVGTG